VAETPVPSSPAQFRSLLAGELDVALTSPDNVLAYRYVPANPLGQVLDARIVGAVDRGLGLALYGRPGITDAEQLRGATLGVDVATSGFALAMYELADSLGVSREEYDVAALGSTPKRLEALLEGRCDATMLNAGNELVAETAGCRALARVADVCRPYLGTVVAVVGPEHLEPARRLASALRDTAEDICSGRAEAVAVEEATTRLRLDEATARRYVERLALDDEGMVTKAEVPVDALETLVRLRRRWLPTVIAGVDPLAAALAPSSGLVDPGPGTP
jgi:ABC-type nitrate/sulfonate/bicarbonate transport system substrate-binding protein